VVNCGGWDFGAGGTFGHGGDVEEEEVEKGGGWRVGGVDGSGRGILDELGKDGCS